MPLVGPFLVVGDEALDLGLQVRQRAPSSPLKAELPGGIISIGTPSTMMRVCLLPSSVRKMMPAFLSAFLV